MATTRSLLALCAIAVALPLPLAAQMQASPAPTLASSIPTPVATAASTRDARTDALVAEWDAAYRLQARRACSSGERNPAVVLVSLTGVLMQSRAVSEAERDTVSKAIYHAWSDVYAAGGCAGLEVPPYQVITALDGVRWLSLATEMPAEVLSGRVVAYGHDVNRRWTYDGSSGEARVSGAEDRFATSRDRCVADMSRASVEIGANHPSLTTRRNYRIPGTIATDPDARVCSAFLAAPAGSVSWTIDYLNPQTMALEASVSLRRGAGESIEVVVRYPGTSER